VPAIEDAIPKAPVLVTTTIARALNVAARSANNTASSAKAPTLIVGEITKAPTAKPVVLVDRTTASSRMDAVAGLVTTASSVMISTLALAMTAAAVMEETVDEKRMAELVKALLEVPETRAIAEKLLVKLRETIDPRTKLEYLGPAIQASALKNPAVPESTKALTLKRPASQAPAVKVVDFQAPTVNART